MTNKVILEIRKHLGPNEKILWAGQPKQGIMLRVSDIFLIPFGCLWGGFAFVWEYNVLMHMGPSFFALFGVPFVVIGAYLIVGRFFVEAVQRKQTYYGITTERIIIVSGIFQQKINTLALRSLSDVSLTESRNQTGSISFGDSFHFASWFGSMAWPGMNDLMGPRLDAIRHPRQVYRIIRVAQKIVESHADRGDCFQTWRGIH